MTGRALISFALAVMLALTSQSMAIARGASAATGQMVLCIGTGSVTVYTDADGAPTSAPHICPDCLVHVDMALLSDRATTPAPPVAQLLVWTAQDQALAPTPRRTPPSRGPPSLI